jgi:hypothetical protein
MAAVIRGFPEFTRAIAAMAARVEAANAVGVMQMAHLVERNIKQQITGGHPKGTKTGAVPGGPPQNITGTLRRSITASGPEILPLGGARAEVGPSVIYGRHVELGGPRWPAGVSYPYVKPGLEAAMRGDEMRRIATAAWAKGIRGQL